MTRVKKNHYRLGQDVVFIWSGKLRMGNIEERRPKNKKIFYNVRGDDGKLYEHLYVDDSEIAAILSHETAIIGKSLAKKKDIAIEPEVEEFESLDDSLMDV
jgi:hypothetical protein